MCRISKGNWVKSWFYQDTEKLTIQRKKVVNEKLHQGAVFRELITKKTLREGFVKCDTTMQWFDKSTDNIEIGYRDYWKNVIRKNKEYSQVIRKYPHIQIIIF